MRPAALAVLVVLIVAVPLAALRSEEPADVRLGLEIRVFRTASPLPDGTPIGESRPLDEADVRALLEAARGMEGEESVFDHLWRPGAAGDGAFTVTCLGRVSYVQDYDVETPPRPEGPTPIRSALSAGVLAEFDPAWVGADRTVTFRGRLTVAAVMRPIPTFVTSLGGTTVRIDLPELAIRREKMEIEVPLGATVLHRAGETDYLLLSAREDGDDPDAGK